MSRTAHGILIAFCLTVYAGAFASVQAWWPHQNACKFDAPTHFTCHVEW